MIIKTNIFPPGPNRFQYVTLLPAIWRNPLEVLIRIAREYGDIAHFQIGHRHIYLLNHPTYIKNVLVTHNRNFIKSPIGQRIKYVLGNGLITSEGNQHLRQRRLAESAFYGRSLSQYSSVMIEYGKRLSTNWINGQTLDMYDQMVYLTLPIVTKTLFGTEVHGEVEEISKAVARIIDFGRLSMIPFFEVFLRMPLPQVQSFHLAMKRLDSFVYWMINQHKGNPHDSADLLSIFIHAQELEQQETRTDTEVRDLVISFFLAGHETIATALCWVWYLLSQHPSVESELHAELDSVLAGRLPTIDDVPNLRYTKMVLAETLRLYPPVWVIGRTALNNYQISNYIIPAGSAIFMSQYLMHRDSRFFSEPDRFKPQRWASESDRTNLGFAYFPFSHGPRGCIGESFAWLEGVLLIATLAQEWKIKCIAGHRVKAETRFTLRPKSGLPMIITRRDQTKW